MMAQQRRFTQLYSASVCFNVCVTLVLIICANMASGWTYKRSTNFMDGPVDSSTAFTRRDDNGIRSPALNESVMHNKTFFNPVLRNFKALEEWMRENGKAGTKSRKPGETDAHISKVRVVRRSQKTPFSCDGGLCSRSLCPWMEMKDVQLSRTPIVITYAMCLNTDCNYNFSRLGSDVQRSLEVSTGCEQVTIDIRVIENGCEKWLTDWPVACVCAQRKVVTAFPPDVHLVPYDPREFSIYRESEATNPTGIRGRSAREINVTPVVTSQPQPVPDITKGRLVQSIMPGNRQLRQYQQSRTCPTKNEESFQHLMKRRMTEQER